MFLQEDVARAFLAADLSRDPRELLDDILGISTPMLGERGFTSG